MITNQPTCDGQSSHRTSTNNREMTIFLMSWASIRDDTRRSDFVVNSMDRHDVTLRLADRTARDGIDPSSSDDRCLRPVSASLVLRNELFFDWGITRSSCKGRISFSDP